MNKIGLKRNRIITMILTVCMIVALIPSNVFADTTYTTTFTYQSKSFKVSKPTGSAYTFLLSDVLIMLDIDGDVKNLSLEDLGALSAEKKNNVWYLTMNNNFVNGEMTVTYADDSSKTIKYSVGQDSIGVAFYGYLNFDAADGTGELITTASGKTYTNQMYCRQGYSYVLPECPYEKEGYTFAGWEIYGSVYQPGETFLFTGTTKAITLWMNNEGEIVNQSDSYPITVDSQVTNGSFDVPSYARAGQTITINPVADAGYSVYNVTVNGKKVNPVNGVYSFKMTSTATTVSGAFYRSLDGGTESAPVLLNDTSVCYLTGGWYNVSGRTSFNHQIIFANDTHLVLEDGCEMSVTGLGKDAAIRSIMDNGTVDTLSIHGDTGKLNLTNGTNYGIYAGYFNLYGGNITVFSTSVIPAIQAYKDIKIVDGSINANKSTIVSEQGNVYINGGEIVLTNTGLTTKSINCKNSDLKISGGALDTSGAVYGYNVRISSGQVSVKKLEYYREFVLGCSNAEDFISTTSIATSYGYVQKITEGIVLKDENENEYQGTLTKTDAVALGGKKLSLASTYDADYKVTVKAANFGTLKANKTTAKPGELVTITASPVKGFKLKELLCNNKIVLPNTAGEYLINMPYEDVTINAVFVKQTFTVTWKNIDGTVLEIDENVEYGSAPFYDGEVPVKNGSTSAFIGWDKEYSAVIEDVTYTAQYGEEIEHSHKMIKTDAKEATCKEAGSNEYYTCETCEKIFKDANGQIETTVEAEIIAATGNHDFSNNGTCACGAVDKVQDAKLAGYTISLKENIGVNLYMNLSEEIVNDPEAKLVITLPNGTENEILVTKATKSGTGSSALYIFSSGISAKEMTADIKAQIVLSDGRVGDEYTVTIQDYAKFIIDNSVVGAANYNASYEKSAPLVKSMMNYGAAAQVYFDYKTDKLANSILDDEDKVIPTEIEGLEDYNYTYPTASETTSFAGSSLILKDAVRMKFVVKSTETLTTDNVTVTIDGTPISSSRILIETDGANQNITVTNLKPNEYGKSINVTAAGLTLENASVYGYIYKSQASSKTAEAMKNLGRALYFYGVEAAKYSK